LLLAGSLLVGLAGGYSPTQAQAEATGTANEPPTLIGRWDGSGSENGEFDGAYGVATDSSGNVYVVDTYNNRIQKFDSEGNYITKWGELGVDNGDFYYPEGVATDSSGNVYVADSENGRIQKFDSSGTFITKWEIRDPYGYSDSPSDVDVDSSGNVYVSTYELIYKFGLDGNFIDTWGDYGSGDGEFDGAYDVATDSSGNVYVADTYNNRIQKFDSEGNFIAKWGELGIGDGEFYRPAGVATDSSGNVYVADTYNNRIQKFDSEGNFITKWEIRDFYGDLDEPSAVDVDSSGNVYVSSYDTVYKFGEDNGAAPKVSATTPASGKTGVRRDSNITATFSEQMDSYTLSNWGPSSVKIVKASTRQEVWLADVSCDNPCWTVTIDPSSNLAKKTKYKATITTKAKDLSGKALSKNYSWTFTTGRR
jgi:DNA-binding beta-propeller fold protein YncE